MGGVRLCVCEYVCPCVRVSVRACVRVCVCLRACARVHACMRVYERASLCVYTVDEEISLSGQTSTKHFQNVSAIPIHDGVRKCESGGCREWE